MQTAVQRTHKLSDFFVVTRTGGTDQKPCPRRRIEKHDVGGDNLPVKMNRVDVPKLSYFFPFGRGHWRSVTLAPDEILYQVMSIGRLLVNRHGIGKLFGFSDF